MPKGETRLSSAFSESGRRVSNPRPSAWEAAFIALSSLRFAQKGSGKEPNNRLTSSCLGTRGGTRPELRSDPPSGQVGSPFKRKLPRE